MEDSLEAKAALAGCVAAVLATAEELDVAGSGTNPDNVKLLLQLGTLLRKLNRYA